MLGRLVLMSALITHPTYAAPPPGADLSSETHAWFERQHSVLGGSCCENADGHLLDAEDWRTMGSEYQVRIAGQWIAVPNHNLRDTQGGPNPTGHAIVWYQTNSNGIHLWCFAPGSGL